MHVKKIAIEVLLYKSIGSHVTNFTYVDTLFIENETTIGLGLALVSTIYPSTVLLVFVAL